MFLGPLQTRQPQPQALQSNLHILENTCIPQCPPTNVLLLTQCFGKGTVFLLFIVYLPTCSHFTAVQTCLSQPKSPWCICKNWRNSLNRRWLFLMCEGRCGEHYTHSSSLGPGKEECWPTQDSRQCRAGCPSPAGESEALWDKAGAGGALWHEQQCCLTNQFGDMRVVELLHTGSLPQELLNVSWGEDVRWKKGTVSFLSL